ncbi:sialate O-acetylesterase [Shewanella sp. UCD-KL21]|uniref:sialate O-acetylesterase n=1 Tax=Shewanella sp. UCD-KL21 TaxID=1917164 RepID=UPI0009FB5D7A|nr:sialate O-acetylesterase [Shewanella sp. UCD-KL21]
MKKLICSLFLIPYIFPLWSKELSVAGIFTDQLILQRDQVNRIWGQGIANQKVIISFNGIQTVERIDKNGQWQTSLAAMPAGGPYQLVIESNNKTISLSDVLIGDVWLASGQSNMEWKLNWKVDNWQAEIKDSHYPNIRFVQLETAVKISPQNKIITKGWQVANPSTVGNFSAVAWFFAKRNHLDKGVPVGIIESNVGGSPAEAWTPTQALLALKGYRNDALEIINNLEARELRLQIHKKNKTKKRQLINSNDAINSLAVHKLEFDDSLWQQVTIPLTTPLTDIVWLRKTITLATAPIQAQLSFGELNQLAKVFVNGQLVENKGWDDKNKIITLPKNLLQQGKNTIAIRVLNSWNNKVNVGRAGKVWLSVNDKKINLQGQWRMSNTLEAKIPKVEPITHWPSVLYNAMIHPLTRFTIKGVIWYQGESNVSHAKEYKQLFTAMIQSWRKQWAIGDFPFIYVQLASWLPQKNDQLKVT